MFDHPIVDTHVHLWDPKRLRYRWLDNIEKLNRPYLPADYDASCGSIHVEKFVFVQCDCLPEQNLQEVAFVNDLAEKDGRISGIVAFAPVERGASVRAELKQLADKPRVKGVRRLLQSEADVQFCLQPAFLEGVAQLAEFGLSFDICVKHPQLRSSVELVRRVPQVSFVLDHIAKPDIRAGLLDPWRAELRALSKLPNVYCKISGLVTEADFESWKPADLRPYIDHVMDCFGPQRVMFGSDWPVVLLASRYDRWAEALRDALSDLTADERRQVFHDNAEDIYRLK